MRMENSLSVSGVVKMFLNKSFLVYFWVGVISTVISTLLLYIGREVFLISVVILNPIITLLMFFVKYIMYDKGGMVKKEEEKDDWSKMPKQSCRSMETYYR